MKNSLECGELVRKELNKLQKEHSNLILDVRGEGLMNGIELNVRYADTIFENLKDNLFLVGFIEIFKYELEKI